MMNTSLVYPMFAMVLYTFGVLLVLFRLRLGYVQSGKLDRKYFSTYQEGVEPETSVKLARNFSNLLEAPTLFYVACLTSMVTDQSTTLITTLAWLYVGARVVHSIIHTGRNTLVHRIIAYFSSWAVLIAIWVCIVIGVATSA